MKAKLYFYAKASAVMALAGLVTACASPQDAYGAAVSRGDVGAAAANSGPNYANMRIYRGPNHYVVPMQIAIAQGNRRMAGYLLDNGARRTVEGQSLAYYAAANGKPDMARYFVSRGVGGDSDVSRGSSAMVAGQQRARRNSQAESAMARALLGALVGGGGSRSSSGGHTVECPVCHGSGKDEYNTTSNCLRCDGRGTVDSRAFVPPVAPF